MQHNKIHFLINSYFDKIIFVHFQLYIVSLDEKFQTFSFTITNIHIYKEMETKAITQLNVLFQELKKIFLEIQIENSISKFKTLD